MVSWPIITVALARDIDIIPVRQRARAIAAELGFDVQDQTRIATAVSEIARNALGYAGGGKVEFVIHPRTSPPRLVIIVSDSGPGIPDLEGVLAGRARGEAGLGLGIIGAHRLMDAVAIDSRPGRGTTVRLEKKLPPSHWGIAAPRLAEIARALAGAFPEDVLGEVQAQNQELMRSLTELRIKQEETTRLNQELERTNQGVVALYAELDQKAIELQTLNATLEDRVARAISQQEEAEANLRQSQKMEAVGQLTGGLAHDFNNLLQIVIGNLDVLVRKLPEQDARLRRSAASAMEGARRAATLTQRLLAFSRRQPLQPQPVAAGELVDGMIELLQRTLGETISIVTEFAPDLAQIEVDPNQLENALVNLTVNARDAMKAGGTLRLRTRNVRAAADPGERPAASLGPGRPQAGPMQDFVAIEVSDDGCGMSPDTLARAFEPFFTTKDVGKGTGLGLSMVYGFVKQSGGNVRVISEEGKGTTVVLLFPAVGKRVLPASPAAARRAARDMSGKTILVVEDDADVRAYTCEALRELGCVVIEAPEGASALAAIRDNPGIDLLFTDVVLPGGIFGRELVDRALAARPGLKVLFTTGYERDQIVHMGRLDPGISVLPKPFTFEALAERISAALFLDETPGTVRVLP